MKIGIFARTFEAPTLAGVLDAVASHDIRHIQLNTSCMGVSDMPDGLDPTACRMARQEIDARDIKVVSLSATYNMIHPDPTVRAQGLRRLEVLASRAAELGTDLLTLCTGTRNPDNMWQDHPQNSTAEAWKDLLAAMEQAGRTGREVRRSSRHRTGSF